MRRSSVFICTFAITLTLALLLGGLLIADVNTRRVTFEESTPPYTVASPPSFDFPLSAGGEALRAVYKGEKMLLRFLWDNFENIT